MTDWGKVVEWAEYATLVLLFLLLIAFFLFMLHRHLDVKLEVSRRLKQQQQQQQLQLNRGYSANQRPREQMEQICIVSEYTEPVPSYEEAVLAAVELNSSHSKTEFVAIAILEAQSPPAYQS